MPLFSYFTFFLARGLHKYILYSNWFTSGQFRRTSDIMKKKLVAFFRYVEHASFMCFCVGFPPFSLFYIHKLTPFSVPPQARLPECRPDTLPEDMPEKAESREEIRWRPGRVVDTDLLMYLRAARSIAAFAGMCGGSAEDRCEAEAMDQTTVNALDTVSWPWINDNMDGK